MEEIYKKVDEVDKKVERIRKHFVWVLILTSILIIFLAVFVFFAPAHLWNYSNEIYVTVP